MTARWTPRQRAMLDAMGLRVWEAVPAGEASVVESLAKAPREAAASVRSAVALPAGAMQFEAGATVALPSSGPSGERPPDIATMDWTELRAAVAACTACSLCTSRTNTVFGCGSQEARWMVVGEAPGKQEDLRGEPFVGKSGQLLDNMLRALQLTRDADMAGRQVYIANTLKCRPPANRNPEPGELAMCEPFLIRQIELVRPSIILAMGRFAVQALLRSSEPIGRLRGQVHRYQGVRLVVTYHPAYLLRNPQDKARAWEDLCLARAVIAGGNQG